MPLQIERQMMILKLIKERKTINVKDLSEMFDVSANTIRRDLTSLEKQGALERTRGGAVLSSEIRHYEKFVQPYNIRQSERSLEKSEIDLRAAKLVSEGDTIIIDAGTTTYEFARHITNFTKLTILTNFIDIPNAFANDTSIIILLSGGILRPTSRSLIGFPAEQFFDQFHADKVFLGTGGISLESGLTNANIQEIPVKKKMIEASREVIVLADHHKMGKTSLGPFCPLDLVHKIVTNELPDPRMMKAFESLDIEVLIPE